jgi:predicted Mrr-cat superfamily restriction endonuclease
MTLWVVRAGANGEQEQDALTNNIITIAWNDLPDLSTIDSQQSLKQLYLKFSPNINRNSLRVMVNEIWDFAKRIKIGDLVALPLIQSQKDIAIGVVTGGYEYKTYTPEIKHTRKVNWIRTVPKSELDIDLQRSFGTPKTVFSIRKNNAEIRTRRILKRLEQSADSVQLSPQQDDIIYPQVLTSKEEIAEILHEFRIWLRSEDGQKLKNKIENEMQEVKELMKKLDSMDRKTDEFTDWVLYGLLPHVRTQYAKRFSIYNAFWNIKKFFSKNYGYKEEDWNIIANKVYTLIKNFYDDRNSLSRSIEEFIADKIYSRGLQSGAITPILFSIDSSFPVINSRVVNTYNDFATIFGWNDTMSSKLEQYPNNIIKCRKLMESLNSLELKNPITFDIFCYWYDNFYNSNKDKDEDEGDEDDEAGYKLKERIKIAELDFPSFLNSIKPDALPKVSPHYFKNPDMAKINDIILNCKSGRWVLPNFQRYFDWKRNNIKEFLESIFKDYYVGLLLFWETGPEPQLKTMPIKGVEIREGNRRVDFIILDGQQRITSLYYAIMAPQFSLKGSNKLILYFYINFATFFKDDSSGEIIEVLPWRLTREESFKKMLFPFYELERYGEWVYDFETYMHNTSPYNHDKIRQITRIMDRKLLHIRDGFEIPYIVLPATMELTQVTEIFERINTMGKELNVFDLLIARLSNYDIDLRRAWDDTNKRYPKIKAYNRIINKLPIYILQSISLCYNKTSSTKREDILNIYQNIFQSSDISFEEKWYEMSEYIDKAIDRLENLRDGLGVKDETELPFAPTIPVLAALIREIDKRQNKIDCLKKLKIWYWSSVFSNAYSGAVDTQMSADFKEMKDWFQNDANLPRTVNIFRKEFAALELRSVEHRSNAIYRGIMSLLALQGAKDFATTLSLENAKSNDKDHIFPMKEFRSEENINSILNMTWMSDETNRYIKGH